MKVSLTDSAAELTEPAAEPASAASASSAKSAGDAAPPGLE